MSCYGLFGVTGQLAEGLHVVDDLERREELGDLLDAKATLDNRVRNHFHRAPALFQRGHGLRDAVISREAERVDKADNVGQETQLVKVDKAIDLALVALVHKRNVLHHDRWRGGGKQINLST